MESMKSRRPVLVDQSIHWAFAALYAIISAFGVFVMVSPERGPVLNVLGGAIALLCVVATIAAVTSVRATSLDVHFEKVELYSTIGIIMFSVTYITVSGATVGGMLVLTALMIFPTWRVISLFKKLRGDLF